MSWSALELSLDNPLAWEAAMSRLQEVASDTPPNKAPYKIVERNKKFVVVNNGNEVKATFDDRDKALAYLRALYRNVPGAVRKADTKSWTGKQKRAS